ISDTENTIFVSAASLWEIWLKQSIGKLQLPNAFENSIDDEGFEGLPVTGVHARHVASLPWHHRDPFDRMLIAQAKTDGLILLTADQRLGQYGEFIRVV